MRIYSNRKFSKAKQTIDAVSAAPGTEIKDSEGNTVGTVQQGDNVQIPRDWIKDSPTKGTTLIQIPDSASTGDIKNTGGAVADAVKTEVLVKRQDTTGFLTLIGLGLFIYANTKEGKKVFKL